LEELVQSIENVGEDFDQNAATAAKGPGGELYLRIGRNGNRAGPFLHIINRHRIDGIRGLGARVQNNPVLLPVVPRYRQNLQSANTVIGELL